MRDPKVSVFGPRISAIAAAKNLNHATKASTALRALIALFLCANAFLLHAQTYSTLASFSGANGADPNSEALVQGLDGNFYGTTQTGGANQVGVVFRITPQGTLTALHSFCAQPNCTDGSGPRGGLVLGRDGNFYGTTVKGGTENLSGGGNGTIFKITPAGTLTVLHSFCGAACSEGVNPYSRLVESTGGTFFGTTLSGGVYGLGTVYKITLQGVFSTIYNFCAVTGCPDGASPILGLIQGSDGKLYGLTYAEMDPSTLFSITTTGKLTTLHTFCPGGAPCTDGTFPAGELVQGVDGNFFGVNHSDGSGNGGTIYEITPEGQLTVPYSFCGKGKCPDGNLPSGGLALATDGNFYGTAGLGGICFTGAPGCGTLFQMTPDGAFTLLYTFCPAKKCLDGEEPDTTLVQGTDGALYGLASYGGTSGDGLVFKLDMGLEPFVRLLPALGKPGARIFILGTNLAGATEVSFNGTPGSFKVVSSSQITAAVPVGATSGLVTVTTPQGTFSSNVAFDVP
jgi:uncharacterized repeat protein (TIGR03803 family)